jgi:alkanesulfonate monooxygenase SsuD/methylene tetrahydromethanopterin reductase-like flavin-dependent oxidoreductase (luciferase family)
MHVGLSLSFQNPGAALPDAQVWANEVRLSERAIALGFDGIWATEHHFSDYEITPEPVQFLTYMAARDSRIKLGTMVIVLPWHDPIRVAEQVSVLDTLSGGRVILGLGRGLAKEEFDAFGIPLEESRARFVEAAELVLDALETGVLRYDGVYYKVPERRLRPAPIASFRRRSYAAALSPETFPIMARLGLGMLIIGTKSWDVVAESMDGYRELYQSLRTDEPPAPLANAFFFCDRDRGRAEEMARRYMGNYWRSVIEHYKFTGSQYEGTKGYEHYAKMAGDIQRDGPESAVEGFLDVQVWGTPKECLEKILWFCELTGAETFLPVFGYGGMPVEDAQRSMELFAEEIMPTLQAFSPAAALTGSGAAPRSSP